MIVVTGTYNLRKFLSKVDCLFILEKVIVKCFYYLFYYFSSVLSYKSMVLLFPICAILLSPF